MRTTAPWRAAFGYLERNAAVSRRGRGGRESVAGAGLLAAAFRHRTSRAGDPQLHTHVLIANLTRTEDGVWRSLDGRRLYAHAKTAGYLYEARLRAELTRSLGVAWSRPRNGIADVVGVPPEVLRAFSRRRAEIERELKRLNLSGAAASQIAALETRRRKDYDVTPEQLAPEWRERARRLGLDAAAIEARVLGRERATHIERRRAGYVAQAAGEPEGPDARAFGRDAAGCHPDVVRAPAGRRRHDRRRDRGAGRRAAPFRRVPARSRSAAGGDGHDPPS